MQVEKEIKRREERDHELLHLYVEATKDTGEYGHMIGGI